ncbi:hypothetical protein CYMTET_14508, partial [Cymbomonas tetramitiformis]
MQEAIKVQEDAKVERETLPVCTPASGTYVSRIQYLEEKVALLEKELLAAKQSPLSPEELGLCLVKSDVAVPEINKSKKRLTQEWGSMTTVKMRERLRKQEFEAEMAEIFRGAEAEINKVVREKEAAERQQEQKEARWEAEMNQIYAAAEKEIQKIERAAVAAEGKKRRAVQQAAEKARKAAEVQRRKREREQAKQEKDVAAQLRKVARLASQNVETPTGVL